jgi:hypothetical protein
MENIGHAEDGEIIRVYPGLNTASMIILENDSRDMGRQWRHEGMIVCDGHRLLNKLTYLMSLYDIMVDSPSRMGSDKPAGTLGARTREGQRFKRRSLSGRFASMLQQGRAPPWIALNAAWYIFSGCALLDLCDILAATHRRCGAGVDSIR